MKKIFAIFLGLIALFYANAQQQDSIFFPTAQIEKLVDRKYTILQGNIIEVYAGKFVQNQIPTRYIKLVYIHKYFICDRLQVDRFEGYIFEDEFDKLMQGFDKLLSLTGLMLSYPENYKVSYFIRFDDGTEIKMYRKRSIKWAVNIQGQSVPIKYPQKLKQILQDAIDQARKL